MSKVDELRALREARWAHLQPKKVKQAAPHAAPTPVEAPCGHQNLGGKKCTRPKDHPQKSHRYA